MACNLLRVTSDTTKVDIDYAIYWNFKLFLGKIVQRKIAASVSIFIWIGWRNNFYYYLLTAAILNSVNGQAPKILKIWQYMWTLTFKQGNSEIENTD